MPGGRVLKILASLVWADVNSTGQDTTEHAAGGREMVRGAVGALCSRTSSTASTNPTVGGTAERSKASPSAGPLVSPTWGSVPPVAGPARTRRPLYRGRRTRAATARTTGAGRGRAPSPGRDPGRTLEPGSEVPRTVGGGKAPARDRVPGPGRGGTFRALAPTTSTRRREPTRPGQPHGSHAADTEAIGRGGDGEGRVTYADLWPARGTAGSGIPGAAVNL